MFTLPNAVLEMYTTVRPMTSQNLLLAEDIRESRRAGEGARELLEE